MKIRIISTHALTRIEAVVVIAMLSVAGFVFWPAFQPAKTRSGWYCSTQLRNVGTGFQMWSEDHFGRLPMHVSTNDGGTMELVEWAGVAPHLSVLSNLVNGPNWLLCPQDSKRSRATNFEGDFTSDKISYFVGVDALLTNSSMLLSGDRNLKTRGNPNNHLLSLTTNDLPAWTREMHSDKGNILFADGHVEGMNTVTLRGRVATTGFATNRLAMP